MITSPYRATANLRLDDQHRYHIRSTATFGNLTITLQLVFIRYYLNRRKNTSFQDLYCIVIYVMIFELILNASPTNRIPGNFLVIGDRSGIYNLLILHLILISNVS